MVYGRAECPPCPSLFSVFSVPPWLRGAVNGWWKTRGEIVVLYDGSCKLCQRSVFFLRPCDWLHRLTLANYHDAEARKRYAPDISLARLEHEMHVVFPDGKVLAGFDEFRRMSLHLPPLWWAAPILYLPGMRVPGRMVYRLVASNRRCMDGSCKV